MDKLEREQLYNTAWNHFGAETQLDMLIEEMAELIHAILGTRRNGVTYSYAFSEEMADVLICLEQVETRMRAFPTTKTVGDEIKITGCLFDQVEQIKEQKLLRLKERLMESVAKAHSDAGDEIGANR